MKEIEEGKLTDAAARMLALAVKKKVIRKGREVRSIQDSEKKLDLLFFFLNLQALVLTKYL